MTRTNPIFASFLCFVSTTAWAAQGQSPADYTAQWPLTVPAGASVVRLPLPAEVLMQLQTPDARDLRVFNAAGQPVPMALDPLNRTAPAAASTHAPAAIELPALPIEGDALATSAPDSTLSLRIDENPGGQRVVRLNVAAPDASTPSFLAAESRLLGVLFDARAVTPALQAVELQADWPAGRPVRFRLHASSDLHRWQALGEVTAYRHGDFTAPAHLVLGSMRVKGQYLRLSWSGQGEAAVSVRSARLLPVTAQTAPRPGVTLILPSTSNTSRSDKKHQGVMQWRMPFATPLTALDVRMADSNAVMPLRVLARTTRERPWTPLAQHLAYTFVDGGQARHSPPIELGSVASANWREWRIEPEAIAASALPAMPPHVTAWFAPVQLVFVASGHGPYTLAAGLAQAQTLPLPYLPLHSLIPGHDTAASQPLPTATMNITTAALPTVAALPLPGGIPTRQWLLWAVLLAGVATLAGITWTLLRQTDTRPGAQPPH